MSEKTYNVLFLCAGNSARSISLPLEKLDKLALQRELAKIGGVQS